MVITQYIVKIVGTKHSIPIVKLGSIPCEKKHRYLLTLLSE